MCCRVCLWPPTPGQIIVMNACAINPVDSIMYCLVGLSGLANRYLARFDESGERMFFVSGTVPVPVSARARVCVCVRVCTVVGSNTGTT